MIERQARALDDVGLGQEAFVQLMRMLSRLSESSLAA
jgi:hypothetical protein